MIRAHATRRDCDPTVRRGKYLNATAALSPDVADLLRNVKDDLLTFAAFPKFPPAHDRVDQG